MYNVNPLKNENKMYMWYMLQVDVLNTEFLQFLWKSNTNILKYRFAIDCRYVILDGHTIILLVCYTY